MEELFFSVLILFVSILVAGLLFHIMQAPTILGYIAVGILLGSSVTGLFPDGPALDFMAEAGIILLLFMVGLEFSLTEFWSDKGKILKAGALQGFLVGLPVGSLVWCLGWGIAPAILLGASVAMSSTALSAKQLADHGELTTRHGRMAISVLVFQDLAAIPLLAMLAIWQSGGQPGPVEISLEILKVLAIFAVALVLARPVLHSLLMAIYRRGNSELLVLASLAIIAMAAQSAHLAGASAALGAFLAGLILGESDVRHRIEEDLRPFRDVFASIFFVSIGLQLDLSQLGSSPLAVLAWLLVLLPAKALLNFIALKISGSSARDALQTAVILAHGGEFGLLLLSGALTASLISTELGQPLLLALVVSMGLGPILFRSSETIARNLCGGKSRMTNLPQREEVEVAREVKACINHIVFCGADNLARLAAKAVRLAELDFVMIEPDLRLYLTAREEGLPVILGDPGRTATLEAARANVAEAIVITKPSLQRQNRIVDWFLEGNAHGKIVLLGTSQNRDETMHTDQRILQLDPELYLGMDLARLVLSAVDLPKDEVEKISRALTSNDVDGP